MLLIKIAPPHPWILGALEMAKGAIAKLIQISFGNSYSTYLIDEKGHCFQSLQLGTTTIAIKEGRLKNALLMKKDAIIYKKTCIHYFPAGNSLPSYGVGSCRFSLVPRQWLMLIRRIFMA